MPMILFGESRAGAHIALIIESTRRSCAWSEARHGILTAVEESLQICPKYITRRS
jgi:hypothetical protein